MKMTRSKSILAVALVFLAGTLFGGLVVARVAPVWSLLHPPSPEAAFGRIQKLLTYRLTLNPSQQKDLGQILVEAHHEIEIMRREVAPRIRSLILASESRLREKLTPEQQAELDKIIAERWKQLNAMPFFKP